MLNTDHRLHLCIHKWTADCETVKHNASTPNLWPWEQTLWRFTFQQVFCRNDTGFGQNTQTLQTDRQRSNSIGRTVLQTVAQKQTHSTEYEKVWQKADSQGELPMRNH